jgi:hypothetical protein
LIFLWELAEKGGGGEDEEGEGLKSKIITFITIIYL